MFPSKHCQPISTTSSRESVSSDEGGKPVELLSAAKSTPTPPPPQTTAPGMNSYCELGDGQVMEILASHLTGSASRDSTTTTWQQGEGNADSALYRNRDLVLFKGAIEHAARLCRVMVRMQFHESVHH